MRHLLSNDRLSSKPSRGFTSQAILFSSAVLCGCTGVPWTTPGKVFTVEMHQTRMDQANPGEYVGLNIKGLDRNNMTRSGDVMVYKKDTTLGQTKAFDAQIQVLDIPNEIK
eukprot:84479-Amphidinium_carterae.1